MPLPIIVALLAAELGATLVEVEQVEVKVEIRDRTGAVKVRNPGGLEASMKVERELREELKRRLTVRDQFEGRPPDFDAAERLLDQKRLRNDSNFVSLLEARRSTNRIKERTVSLNLTEESNANLTIAAGLKVPGYFRLDAQAEEAVKRRVEYRVTMKVVF